MIGFSDEFAINWNRFILPYAYFLKAVVFADSVWFKQIISICLVLYSSFDL